MGSDWFSDEGSEDGAETTDQAEANAKRDAVRRVLMVSRTRERSDYWQRQLAAERFDEFKPEMRRRIQVERTLLDGLELGKAQTFVLLRTYQQDAVHMPTQLKTEAEQAHSLLDERIAKAVRRKRDLAEALRVTPQKQTAERRRILAEIDAEQAHVDDLKAEMRRSRH